MDENQILLWLLLGVNSVAVILLLFRSYRERQNTSFFRGIIEAMKEGIWVIDKEARTKYVNQAAANLFDTTPQLMRGKTVFDFVHPEQFASTEKAMQRRMQGEEQAGEHRIIRKDGKSVWIRHSTVPLYNLTQITGALAVFTDITEQHEAKEKAAETEARYRVVIENVSDLVYMIDHETRILFLNPVFTTITGWETGEWLGKSGYDVVHPDDHPKVQALLQTVDVAHPTVLPIEARLLTKSGESVTLDFRIHPLVKDGQLMGFTGVGRNISERKRLALQELQVALEYERTGTLRRFMRHASHDFRTPLSVINSSVHLLRRKLDVDNVAKVEPQIGMIESQVMHINEQLNNLMELTQGETKRSSLHFKPQALGELVQEVIEEQAPAIERKHHRVILNYPPVLPPVQGDEKDLRRVIRHLLINAISYTPDNGTIRVELTHDRTNVIFAITDSGIGIATEELPRIFDPFYRVDRARNLDTGGMGLGLTISKAILEAHGGSLQVESTLGEGTTFTLMLPVV
jgi:PAS domain S-box-containing protein